MILMEVYTKVKMNILRVTQDMNKVKNKNKYF